MAMEPVAIAALVQRLEALDYAVPPTGLDPDTAPLVERLVRDLVQTADSYRSCKTRAAKQATELESWRDKARGLVWLVALPGDCAVSAVATFLSAPQACLSRPLQCGPTLRCFDRALTAVCVGVATEEQVDALRQENARVMKENTAVHQTAMHAAEAAERRERALRVQLQELQQAGHTHADDAAAANAGDYTSTHECSAPAEAGNNAATVGVSTGHTSRVVAEELEAERARVASRDAEIQRLSKALEWALQQQQADMDAGGASAPDAPPADGALVASLRRESDALRARVRELTNALAAAKRRSDGTGSNVSLGGSSGPILALSVGAASSSGADGETPAAVSASATVVGEQLSQCLRQLASTQATLERTKGERDAARRMLDSAVSAAQHAMQRQQMNGDGGADDTLPAVPTTAALQFALDEAEARAQAACDARDRALARATAAEAALEGRAGSDGADTWTPRMAPFTRESSGLDTNAVVAQLRSLLATADATREQLVAKLRASLAACHAAEQRCSQAQSQAQEAIAEVSQLRALAASLADERDAFRAQLNTAQDQHHGLDALAATHGFAAAAARDATAVAERSLAEAREQAAAAARDCATLRAAVMDARAAADAAVNDARQLRSALEYAQQEATSARAEAASAVAASQGAQAVAIAKSREVDDVTEAFGQLSGEHATLCMSLSALQREHEEAHHALAAAHEALDAASMRLAELRDDNYNLQMQLAEIANHHAEEGDRNDAALLARLRAAEARTTAAERAREECARDAAAASATCEALRAKLEELVMNQQGASQPVEQVEMLRRLAVLTAERDVALEEAALLKRQLAQTVSGVQGPGTPEEHQERGMMRYQPPLSVSGSDDVSEISIQSAGGHAVADDLRAENAALRERLRRTEAAAAEAAVEMERVQQEYVQLAHSLSEASWHEQ